MTETIHATSRSADGIITDESRPAGTTALVPHTSSELRWMNVPRDQMAATLRQSLYPGATDEMILAVMDYCRAAGLNVMLRPVHIVPMYVPQKVVERDGQRVTIPGGMRDVIMPGINHYRVQAARTGRYLGLTPIEWGPEVTSNLGGVQFKHPEYARVAAKVRVGDDIVEFHAEEYFLECYATKARDSKAPNAMWEKRPRGQLAKTVEAQALRKAFPELGDYTAEEMEGKTIDLSRGEDGVHRADPKPAAANANLDAFAGGSTEMKRAKVTKAKAAAAKVEGDHTARNAAEATAADDKARDASLPDLPGEEADTGEVPAMPADALKAWVEEQKWTKAWKWLNDTMPTMGPRDRQELANVHAAILRAVHRSSPGYKKAAQDFAVAMRIDVPPAPAEEAAK